MRVAVDLRPLQIGHEFRGIGTYLINILSRLPSGTDHHFIFYQFDTSEPLDNYHIKKPASYEIIRIPKPVWRRSVLDLFKYLKEGLYPSFPKLASTHPDIFLQPDFQLGLPRIRRCRIIVVMYDLIPLILRSQYMPTWKESLFDNFQILNLLKRMLKLSLRIRSKLIAAAKNWFHAKRYFKNLNRLKKANKILSISQSTTKDLHRYLGVDKDKIITIPLAPSFRDDKDHQKIRNNITKTISKISRPYLVYVGGTDARRMIGELINAFNIINARGTTVDLILAGNEFREAKLIPNIDTRDSIINSSYKHQIHLIGYLTDAEKAYVLKHAAAFVFPSLYEGFGLPILEAMQVGCPVVAFKNSSIPEIGGNAISYTPTSDFKGIYLATMTLLKEPELAKTMSKKGIAQAAKFNWNLSAKKTWQNILEVRKF